MISGLRPPYVRVSYRAGRGLNTDALKSSHILVAVMDLGERMGHGQVLPALEPRADAASAAITIGLVAREPPGVLFAGFGRRAGS